MLANPLTLVAWVLTYLIHSTLLLAGAWLLERLFRPESVRLRERLWRVALLGGLVTAGAQLALGLAIPAPRWTLARAEPLLASSPTSDAPSVAGAGFRSPEPSAVEPSPARPELTEPIGDEPRERRAPGAEPSRATAAQPRVGPIQLPGLGSLPARESPREGGIGALDELERLARAALAISPATWLALAASASAFAVLAQLGLSAVRLRRRLAGAVELESGPDVELLAELGRRARLSRPVRLFVAPELRSPLSSGLVRPAVYVPPRALSELSGEEREAMLAHELAHVARRDPAWLTLFWLVERACFFQPLNRLARRRLAHSAEVLADDWAVRHTGRHLSLASCLARIAGWMTEGPRLLGAHMTDGHAADGERPRSQLARRIERLLEGRPRGDERQRWWSPLALGVLGTLALVAPGVAAHRATTPRRPAPAPELARRPEPAVERAPVIEVLPALPLAPLGLGAPSATPPPLALDDELRALDSEIELLQGEVAALGLELADYDLEPAVASAVDALEAHARALAARRDRLQAHTRPIDPMGDLLGIRP